MGAAAGVPGAATLDCFCRSRDASAPTLSEGNSGAPEICA
jgi:hypothetical protein